MMLLFAAYQEGISDIHEVLHASSSFLFAKGNGSIQYCLWSHVGWQFRVYVDLPDAGNRKKILKIFLAQENLGPNFSLDELANATEGYSGSDLKVEHCFYSVEMLNSLLSLQTLFLVL